MIKENADNKLKEKYALFNKDLDNLIHLTEKVNQQEMAETIQEMKFHLSTPFMFVIVGEVKAGKSSFINALLEAQSEICAVAPSPMTDTIQQIIYGEEHNMTSISPYLKRITHPEEILKEITIVDTPGTNTIIDHHQEITERFIPHADLIVFVFEAKNPYRQSAWEFFDYIKSDWHKNIIFILQQKDLMNPDDLAINMNGVKEYAVKKGISEPNVFAVSAKEELEKLPSSGFPTLREYIDKEIINANTAILKLKNNVGTALNINEKIGISIGLRKEQYELDKAFREEIKDTLTKQEDKTQRQISILTENLVAAYDSITNEKIGELDKGLSFMSVVKRSFSNILGGDKGLKDWLGDQAKDFELKLNNKLKDKLQNGIVDVADDIQMMGKMVSAKITNSKKVLKDSDDIFSDIAERRANVLSDLQKSFRDFMNNSDNFYDEELLSTTGSMAPNLAAGSGIAVVGVILSTAINGAVFDITGGILTTVGVLFAGASLGWKRKKILKKFKEEILTGREKLEKEVRDTLTTYTTRIKNRIDKNFYAFDNLLEEENTALSELEGLQNVIEKNLRAY